MQLAFRAIKLKRKKKKRNRIQSHSKWYTKCLWSFMLKAFPLWISGADTEAHTPPNPNKIQFDQNYFVETEMMVEWKREKLCTLQRGNVCLKVSAIRLMMACAQVLHKRFQLKQLDDMEVQSKSFFFSLVAMHRTEFSFSSYYAVCTALVERN